MRLPCTVLVPVVPPINSSATGTSGLLATYVRRLFARNSLCVTLSGALPAAPRRTAPVASKIELRTDTAPVVVTSRPDAEKLPRPRTHAFSMLTVPE